MAVFISYSFKDPHKFQDVCFAFENSNIKFWNSDEIAAGQSLRDALRTNIRRCTACVFIATRNSLASAWCQAELGAFWGIGRPVIVYLIDESLSEKELPKQFHGDKFARTIREVVTAAKACDSDMSDPVERPESLQAEPVLSLAVEAFLNRLTYRLKTVWFTGFGSLAPGLWDTPSSTVRRANAFGEAVSYDTARPSEEAEAELKALIAQIVSLRRKKEREIREALIGLFMEVQGQSQSISHHLAAIRFRGATLAEPWLHAQDRLSQHWTERSQDFAFFDERELARLRHFLEEHPAYRHVYSTERSTIDSLFRLGQFSVEDLIEMTRTELSQLVGSLKEELPPKNPAQS